MLELPDLSNVTGNINYAISHDETKAMNQNRLLDANINRSAEGLRVLEDIARFSLDNQKLSSAIRSVTGCGTCSKAASTPCCLQETQPPM